MNWDEKLKSIEKSPLTAKIQLIVDKYKVNVFVFLFNFLIVSLNSPLPVISSLLSENLTLPL